MSLDEVKKRFVEEVKLRAYDDKYIDKNEEREILQIALQQGVTVDSARSALAQVCEGNGYVLESRVLSEIKDLVDTFASNDGKVDEKEFNDAVAQCKKRTWAKRTTCSANAWSSKSSRRTASRSRPACSATGMRGEKRSRHGLRRSSRFVRCLATLRRSVGVHASAQRR